MMKDLGFFYDAARCTGCRTCQVACKEKNKLAAGDFCRRVDAVQCEKDGTQTWVYFSGACNHCKAPACIAVCPTGAMHKAADGTVQHDDTCCIGCGRCVHHCPYGAVFLDRHTGYAHKCDACISRREQGREPACVEACPMRALQFGELKELKDRFGAEHGATLPFLTPERETLPSLLIRGAAQGERAAEIAEPAPQQPEQIESTARIVILGSGAAAVSAMRAIRQRSKTAEITVISREKRLPYSRPMLSKGLLSSFAMDRYPIVEEAWLQDNDITYIGGVEITALDADAHTVMLADGQKVTYDKCIYALGADCFVPPILGRGLPGVFTLRYDRDVHRIRQAMLTARHAAVIGGGITGLELAWELKKAGLSVTVLDVLDQLMDRILDARTAQQLRQAVEEGDIRVVTGARICAIEGDDAAQRIVLEDGSICLAELVVISTGYRANIALAAAAGLKTERAVIVDQMMQTSHADIYACGDCADRSTATWLQSVEQGQVAGANALGAGLPYTALPEPVMVHTADTSLLVAGDMGKRPGLQYRFIYGRSSCDGGRFYVNPRSERRQETHFTFCFADDCLTGAALLGNLSLMELAEQAVAERWDFETLKKATGEKGVELYEE